MSIKVKKAVIPAAGLGTRFLPATKAIPKEMIPIIDTPMIQYIVEEAIGSGIDEIVLITARNKEAIENHFDHNYELEDTLEKKANHELAELSKKVARYCNLISIRQKNPRGLGHAVLCAEPVIGQEPFAVLLGDDLIDSKVPCTRQLIQEFERAEGTSVVGVMEVAADDVSKYGIVGGHQINERTLQVTHLVEKPPSHKAPSRLAIPGRYVLDPLIFKYLKEIPPGRGGEIQLTDALDLLAKSKGLRAFCFEGRRFDTGDRMGLIEATLEFGLRRSDIGAQVKELILRLAGSLR